MKHGWILIAAAFVLSAAVPGEEPPAHKSTGRMYAQEQEVLKAVMTLNTAQAQYYSQSGHWAATLAELGEPAHLIPRELAAGELHGYKFTLTRTLTGYAISAVPTVFGTTGTRTFYSDQSLIVHEHYGPDPATAASPKVGAVWYKRNATR